MRHRLRQSFVLVSIAVILLALMHGIQLGLLQGHMLSSEQFAVLFYGVLTFYAVALLVAFRVMRWIAHRSRPFADCLVGAILLWTVFVFLEPLMPPDSMGSPIELLKLLAVRHCSILRIGSVVLLGLAAGIWYARQEDLTKASQIAILVGGAIAAVALLIAGEREGFGSVVSASSRFHSSLLGYVSYAAFAFAFLGLATRIMLRWPNWPDAIRVMLMFLITTGALALPIYAFHGLVLPVADILTFLDWPRALAIALPMGCFLGGIGWLGHRVWRTYFG